MACIDLRIKDPANRVVLKTMLEAEGHRVGATAPEVIVTDDLVAAPDMAAAGPVLVLAGASQLADAVRAMRHGVYGYIVLPFLPGEAGMMVARALAGVAPSDDPRARSLHQVEAEHIRRVLQACRNNHSQAAQILGIARNTLWRKLKHGGRSATDG
jgi:DNA-binding NtrC family response regulator